MKYFLLLFLFIICTIGCNNSWNQKDQNLFMNDCLAENGAKKVCSCILNCLENQYTNYEAVLQKLPASKIQKELNQCLKNCY